MQVRWVFLVSIVLFLFLGLGFNQAEDDNTISLRFKDAKLRDVLQLLAEECDISIALGEDVEGTVTVNFSDVTPRDAMKTIIQVNDCESYTEHNILVIQKKRPKQEIVKLTTRIFELEHVDASCMKNTVQELLSDHGEVLSFIRRRGVGNEKTKGRSNILIITDVPTRTEEIAGLISQLDKPLTQVLIDVKMVELNLSKLEGLNIKWKSTASPESSLTPTGTASRLGGIKAMPPSEKFFPYTLEDDFKFGTLSDEELTDLMAMFKKTVGVNLLTRPMITTLDNQEAEVFIGESIPVLTNPKKGRSTYTRERIGITLKMTPHILKDNQIVIEIMPEVREISGWMTGTSTKDRYPIISTRRAQTQLRIKNNQTIMLGGLIKNLHYTKVSRVPILGSIPLLGLPFRSKKTITEKIDLVIFITPRISTK